MLTKNKFLKNAKIKKSRLKVIQKTLKEWNYIRNTALYDSLTSEELEEFYQNTPNIDTATIINMVLHPNAGAVLLANFYDSLEDDIRRVVAKHMNTDIDTLRMMTDDSLSDIRLNLIYNPNTTEEIILHILEKETEWNVIKNALASPNLSENILRSLLIKADKENNERFLEALCLNPNVPADMLDILAFSKFKNVRLRSTINDSMSVSTLCALASEPDPRYRRNVAEHVNTPAELLRVLSNDELYYVRSSVASNINTPSDCLLKLATSFRCPL